MKANKVVPLLATFLLVVGIIILYKSDVFYLGKELDENTVSEEAGDEEAGDEEAADDISDDTEAEQEDVINQEDETEAELPVNQFGESEDIQTAAVDPITDEGLNLYSGTEVNGSKFLGTYSTWVSLLTDLRVKGIGEYAIDLRGVDINLTNLSGGSNYNWSSVLTTSDSNPQQFHLHFYSTTYRETGNGSVNFGTASTAAATSVMGAHVYFHEGMGIKTPTSTGWNSAPLGTDISTSLTEDVNNYSNGAIYANGWRFVVDKGVEVDGCAQLYAGAIGTGSTSDFTQGKTILGEDEGNISAGYIEVNSGRWKTLGGHLYSATGAYRVKVGTNDDPENPVWVGAVFGSVRGSGTIRPVTPSLDIPAESLEVTGHTIVQYGVAICPGGGRTYSASGSNPLYASIKVKISGNASILSTIGGITADSISGFSDTNKNTTNRISVSAGSSGNGYGYFTGNTAIVNIVVEISGDAYVTGDVTGNGPNVYFNVNSQSKGVHITVKDRAQVGGNIAYGGSSAASAVRPTDSEENPFFTMSIEGTEKENGVKIGGHLLATNGEDNSNSSSWNTLTKVVNATVNGSVFGYGNLGNESTTTGIAIKRASILIENSVIGGGVYGVATGSATTNRGSTKECLITIKNSTVGHVAPLFAMRSAYAGGGNATNYPIGESNVDISDSIITGKTVMWMSPSSRISAYNLSNYAYISQDADGNVNNYLKALAKITIESDGSRTIAFNTDGYEGIPLAADREDISLTTSMYHSSTSSTTMYLADYTISLAKSTEYPGDHKVSVKNSDFTRSNGNPSVTIMDRGDGTLGTSADITVDNCYATETGKKIDVYVIGTLTGNITTSNILEMSMTAKNTNDLGYVGFVNSNPSYYINTKAKILLENTVTEHLFGKRNSTGQLRNSASKTNRVQFVFQGNNTIGDVLANGADIEFYKDSVTYIKDRFNNTGGSTGETVFDDEWVNVYDGARVYLGHSGTAASTDDLGGARTERIFGSIQGSSGEMYIYKDTSDMVNRPNATYPIFVANTGSILSAGMNLGEWSSDDGSIRTIVTVGVEAELDAAEADLDAVSGNGKIFDIVEPRISRDDEAIQREHDILISFGTIDNADPEKLNDVPLRPWPIISYLNASNQKNGWLILGKPRYQITYVGTGNLEGTDEVVAGQVQSGSTIADQIVKPGQNSYQYTEDDPYAIENITVIPDNPGYEFLYWRLFSATEQEDTDGNIIQNDWRPSTEVVNDAPPTQAELPEVNIPADGKVWISGNLITLMDFMTSRKVPKTESKMLMLTPVYKANYTCKIGNKGYLKLSDAFAAIAEDNVPGVTDQNFKIEMLVPEYSMDRTETVPDVTSVTITTASASDETLPYLGEAGTSCILKRANPQDSSPFKEHFFSTAGSASRLTLTNVVLDGNGEEVTSDGPLIRLSGRATLQLLSGSELRNNRTNSSASAIQGESNPLILEDTKIYNNTTLSPGGAINISHIANVRHINLKGKLYITDNFIEQDGEQKDGNILLEAGGKLYINGSLHEDSVVGVRTDESEHINGHVFAIADDETMAADSYSAFTDDYEEKLRILVDPLNPLQIQFVYSVNFSFIKVKAEDSTAPLNGAKFKLYELLCEEEEHDHLAVTALVDQDSIDDGCWEEIAEDTSGGADKADGLVDMGSLSKGTYMMVETETVSGYRLPEGQWLIEVDPAQTESITIIAHGRSAKMPPAFMIETNDGSKSYKLPNIKTLTLPLAGLPGIYQFLIIGGMIIVITTLLFFLRKRRNYKLALKQFQEMPYRKY